MFDDQPNLGHHTYPDKKKDDGTPRESYSFLKGYKNCFSYAYYFEKKEKEDTAKAFSFFLTAISMLRTYERILAEKCLLCVLSSTT